MISEGGCEVDGSDCRLPACTEFLLESSSFFFSSTGPKTSITMSAFSAESTRMYRPQLSNPRVITLNAISSPPAFLIKMLFAAASRSKCAAAAGGVAGAGAGCWDQALTVQKTSRHRPARVVCESERPMIHAPQNLLTTPNSTKMERKFHPLYNPAIQFKVRHT